jgi:hypothetical protein
MGSEALTSVVNVFKGSMNEWRKSAGGETILDGLSSRAID